MEPDADTETEAAAQPAQAENHAKEEKKKESWWETARFLLILFVAAVALRSFGVAPFSIPSGSMLPALMIGDHLFVAKWPYGYSRYSLPFGIASFGGRVPNGLPDRGDVVVFRYPGVEQGDWVKRVIGLPGDRIEVIGGELLINNRPVPRQRIADYVMPVSANSPCRGVAEGSARPTLGEAGEPACAYPRFRETLPDGRSYDVLDQIANSEGDDFGPIVVPQGRVFVMGDNRDDSLDSRFEVERGGVGLLPVENILGEALIAFWSTDGTAEWIKPWTWFSAARWQRIGGAY